MKDLKRYVGGANDGDIGKLMSISTTNSVRKECNDHESNKHQIRDGNSFRYT